MADILPCPFCGSVKIEVMGGSTFRWRKAECLECGATSGEIRAQTMGQGTRDEWEAQAKIDALAEWNSRHKEPRYG